MLCHIIRFIWPPFLMKIRSFSSCQAKLNIFLKPAAIYVLRSTENVLSALDICLVYVHATNKCNVMTFLSNALSHHQVHLASIPDENTFIQQAFTLLIGYTLPWWWKAYGVSFQARQQWDRSH